MVRRIDMRYMAAAALGAWLTLGAFGTAKAAIDPALETYLTGLVGPMDFVVGFTNYSNANPTVEDQMIMGVRDDGAGLVSFFFANHVAGTGAVDAIITGVHFDDEPSPGVLFANTLIADSDPTPDGVDFDSPPPGGTPPTTLMIPEFSYTSNAPPPANGVGMDLEWLQVQFSLESGKNFSNVEAAFGSGDLRVAMHVQAIECPVDSCSSTSDWLVNSPPEPPQVPEPGTIAVLGAGLAVTLIVRRRRRHPE